MARFSEKLLNIKCVFSFTLKLLSEIFLILRRCEEDIINVHMSSRNAAVNSWQISMKLQFYRQNFEKYSNIVFQWEPVCSTLTHRQTERHDDANSSFSQFCEHEVVPSNANNTQFASVKSSSLKTEVRPLPYLQVIRTIKATVTECNNKTATRGSDLKNSHHAQIWKCQHSKHFRKILIFWRYLTI